LWQWLLLLLLFVCLGLMREALLAIARLLLLLLLLLLLRNPRCRVQPLLLMWGLLLACRLRCCFLNSNRTAALL
jgi:hypothetical protein